MQAYPTANTGTTSTRGYGAMPDEVKVWPRGVSGGVPLANWPWRVAAGAIDYVPAYIVTSLLYSATHASALADILFFAWVGFNSVYMQGLTGQSIGKRITGIRLAAGATQSGSLYLVYPGVGLCFWRLVAHLLDLLIFPFCIGLFRPLWQREYRTFADSLAHTVVTSPKWDGELVQRAPDAGRVQGF